MLYRCSGSRHHMECGPNEIKSVRIHFFIGVHVLVRPVFLREKEAIEKPSFEEKLENDQKELRSSTHQLDADLNGQLNERKRRNPNALRMHMCG